MKISSTTSTANQLVAQAQAGQSAWAQAQAQGDFAALVASFSSRLDKSSSGASWAGGGQNLSQAAASPQQLGLRARLDDKAAASQALAPRPTSRATAEARPARSASNEGLATRAPERSQEAPTAETTALNSLSRPAPSRSSERQSSTDNTSQGQVTEQEAGATADMTNTTTPRWDDLPPQVQQQLSDAGVSKQMFEAMAAAVAQLLAQLSQQVQAGSAPDASAAMEMLKQSLAQQGIEINVDASAAASSQNQTVAQIKFFNAADPEGEASVTVDVNQDQLNQLIKAAVAVNPERPQEQVAALDTQGQQNLAAHRAEAGRTHSRDQATMAAQQPLALALGQALADTGAEAKVDHQVQAASGRAEQTLAGQLQSGHIRAQTSAETGFKTSANTETEAVNSATNLQTAVVLEAPRAVRAERSAELAPVAPLVASEVAAVVAAVNGSAGTESSAAGSKVELGPLSLNGVASTKAARETGANTATTPSSGSYYLPEAVGTRAWRESLSRAVSQAAVDQLDSAHISINPPHLGPIEVRLNIQDGRAEINFSATNPHIREALQDSVKQLTESFKQSGLNLSQVSVGLGMSQQQQQQQAGQQQRHNQNPASASGLSGLMDALQAGGNKLGGLSSSLLQQRALNLYA